MRECRFITSSDTETRELGYRLSKQLRPGDILALTGDLGAGKTTFAQGVGKGLHVTEPIDSPTFTIIKEYIGRMPFYHMDIYRMESAVDEAFGWDEYFYGNGVTLVEWAQQIEPLLPETTIWIRMAVLANGKRAIYFRSHSDHIIPICKELMDE